MKNVFSLIPTYTGDVSGVCSALYELGGMVVMHDPSGCNSTYNTHDEVRWYDMESLIFISALTDIDVAMGNDDRLIRDVCAAARKFRPKFIALANSPLPYLNGTDFAAISRLIEKDTLIPTFYIPTNAMHDYVKGASLAMLEAAKKLLPTAENSAEMADRLSVERKDSLFDRRIDKLPNGQGGFLENAKAERRLRVNVLGMTPLDFAARSSVSSIKRILSDGGFEVGGIWAMESSLDELIKERNADVNLVVSSVGLPLARYFEEIYSTPFVAAVPIAPFAPFVLSALKDAAFSGRSVGSPMKVLFSGNGNFESSLSTDIANMIEACREGEHIRIVGEPVICGSIAAALRCAGCDGDIFIVAATEGAKDLIGECGAAAKDEEEIAKCLSGADIVIADPLYRPLCGKNTHLIELPHLAFSGRMFLSQMVDLMDVGDC